MGSVAQTTPFGKPMREHFLFDKDFRNLNHGSFGTYPTPVRTALRQFQDLAEAAPDKFMRYQYISYLLASRTALANLLNVPVDTCVFVQNATLGVNTVLRNLVYAPGDVIVYFETIYGACEKTIESLLETRPQVRARRVEGYAFPCEHEEIVGRFVEVVEGLRKEGLRAKVAVFDTICALPGVRFPFERLTEECRRLGILSLLDAAHGVGQIPLDLGKLDPDFLVSNCHKWLHAPRGCAILHIPIRNHALIRTTYPTSHGFVPLDPTTTISNPLPTSPTASAFTSLFQFVATADNSAYYTIPAALRFRAEVCGGEAAVMAYCRDVVRRGGDRVAALLGTDVMANGCDAAEVPAAGGLRDCAFANVRLPVSIAASAGEDEGADVRPEELAKVGEFMQAAFMQEFNTYIAVYVYKGRMWTRLSGQVYLDEREDWEWCAGVLEEVCRRVRRGDFRKGGKEEGGDAVEVVNGKFEGVGIDGELKNG